MNLDTPGTIREQLEIWEGTQEWKQFKQYLEKLDEGEDHRGNALSLRRYVTFLEECAKIEDEIRRGRDKSTIFTLLSELLQHKEHFCGRVRGLKVFNGRLRRQLISEVKLARQGTNELRFEMMTPVVEPVVERLAELLRFYDMKVRNQAMRQEQNLG